MKGVVARVASCRNFRRAIFHVFTPVATRVPGCSAARSDTLQTRDRYGHRLLYGPGSAARMRFSASMTRVEDARIRALWLHAASGITLAHRRHVGKRGRPRPRHDGERAHRAAPDVRQRVRQRVDAGLDPAGDACRSASARRRCRARARTSMPVEVLSSSIDRWLMVRDAERRHVDLAGIGLGVGDELGDGRWPAPADSSPAPAAIRQRPRDRRRCRAGSRTAATCRATD